MKSQANYKINYKIISLIVIILLLFVVYYSFDNGNVVEGTEISGLYALGPEDAAVTVVEWSDFECPYCAAAVGEHDVLVARLKQSDPNWEPAVPKLKELAREGKIRLIFKHFPLTSIHPNAVKAAEAAECAGEQGKFWEMHDMLYAEGVQGGASSFKEYAVNLELDSEQFDDCIDSGKSLEKIEADFNEAKEYNIRGTPAFLIDGQLLEGALPFSAFERLI